MSRPSAFPSLLVIAGIVGAILLFEQSRADELQTPRIGALVLPLATSPFDDGLREGLREFGYIEGKTIVIEWRRSAGPDEELRKLAAELARSKAQVIVVYGTPATRAVLEATTTVPVVFGSGAPVESGLVPSLARPGGNATGVSVIVTELTEKRLELLHQVAPRARRIAHLTNSSNPIAAAQLDAALKAARTLGLELLTLDARNADELDTVLGALLRIEANAVFIGADPLLDASRSKIARAVRKAGLPAISPFRQYHDEGVLLSYGTNQAEVGRMMAGYIHKILKGAKPSDLPIEQLSKYVLVIDLRVARQLGLKISRELQMRADEVIR